MQQTGLSLTFIPPLDEYPHFTSRAIEETAIPRPDN